jgi:hypothetical protein
MSAELCRQPAGVVAHPRKEIGAVLNQRFQCLQLGATSVVGRYRKHGRDPRQQIEPRILRELRLDKARLQEQIGEPVGELTTLPSILRLPRLYEVTIGVTNRSRIGFPRGLFDRHNFRMAWGERRNTA